MNDLKRGTYLEASDVQEVIFERDHNGKLIATHFGTLEEVATRLNDETGIYDTLTEMVRKLDIARSILGSVDDFLAQPNQDDYEKKLTEIFPRRYDYALKAQQLTGEVIRLKKAIAARYDG
tara:strand:- start:98 stop:460 length:363 start_codon:yes stop_codon:yes gene_type:complete